MSEKENSEIVEPLQFSSCTGIPPGITGIPGGISTALESSARLGLSLCSLSLFSSSLLVSFFFLLAACVGSCLLLNKPVFCYYLMLFFRVSIPTDSKHTPSYCAKMMIS